MENGMMENVMRVNRYSLKGRASGEPMSRYIILRMGEGCSVVSWITVRGFSVPKEQMDREAITHAHIGPASTSASLIRLN